jgi:hypothetical protein
MRLRLSFLKVIPALALLVLLPRPALAAWYRWGTEGSYVHQTAHLLLCGAMLFFIYEIHRGGFTRLPGFRQIRWSCWLLAFWNVDAVLGHTLEWSLLNPVIVGQGFHRWLLMENAQTWSYYITRFTHYLLLAPAFYLFYRGVKAFARQNYSKLQ